MREFWRRYRKNQLAVIGLAIVICFVAIALLVPFLPLVNPYNISAKAFLPPSVGHPLGTDNLGRDVLSGVLYGSRISLLVGVSATLLSTIIGTLVGSFSGYLGGKVDALLMRTTEMFMVIPSFFLALIIVAIFGASVFQVIVVIGILSWPATARLVRAEFLSLKEQDFVLAARSLGVDEVNIMFGEILPNAASSIVTVVSLQVAQAIIMESSLSFLGLGDPNVMTWGFMLNMAKDYLAFAWWPATFPGLAIVLVVIGLNLCGDGLNEALNPKLRGI